MARFKEDSSTIIGALQTHRGLCLGENHGNFAANRFVIDNIDALHAAGVRYIFMEHYVDGAPVLGFPEKNIRQIAKIVDVNKIAEYNEFLGGLGLNQAVLPNLRSQVARYIPMNVLLICKIKGIQVIGIDEKALKEKFVSIVRGGRSVFTFDEAVERTQVMNDHAIEIIGRKLGEAGEDNKFVQICGITHLTDRNFTSKDGSRAVTTKGIGSTLGGYCVHMKMENPAVKQPGIYDDAEGKRIPGNPTEGFFSESEVDCTLVCDPTEISKALTMAM